MFTFGKTGLVWKSMNRQFQKKEKSWGFCDGMKCLLYSELGEHSHFHFFRNEAICVCSGCFEITNKPLFLRSKTYVEERHTYTTIEHRPCSRNTNFRKFVNCLLNANNWLKHILWCWISKTFFPSSPSPTSPSSNRSY